MNGSSSFLRLEDLLLPPPLPAILSLLIVVGLYSLSARASRLIGNDKATPSDRAAVFVIVTGLAGALVHGLAWAGYASIPLLRGIGWPVAVLGALELTKHKPAQLLNAVREYWRSQPGMIERCALIVSAVIFSGLFAGAFGPAVDADSLDQHLAVPLDWLRHGEAYPRPDWFTARYVGLGESLNMLGLAAGTDGLAALLQFAGLIVAIVAATEVAETRARKLFGALLVLSCPVVVPLVLNQKPMLLPAAALTVGLVIFARSFRTFDAKSALLGFGCAALAMANKNSFLLSGGVVVLVGLIAALRARRVFLGAGVLATWIGIFVLPVWARNFVFYGDPISPLLEKWRPGGDPVVIAYAQQALRDYAGPLTLARLARLPLDLVVTRNPALIHESLGLGVFAFLFALRARGPARVLLLGSGATFALVVALGQPTPRFFLEPYLWCAAAVAPIGYSRLRSVFLGALTAQAAVVAGIAAYLSILLFPGALTSGQRERVMALMAPSYALAKWLDATLPPDAVVLAGQEARALRALSPRPLVIGDLRFISKTEWKRYLPGLVKEKGVTVLVTQSPTRKDGYDWLAAQYGTPLVKPAKIRDAARSPFNRGTFTEWALFRLDMNGRCSGRDK